MAIKLGKIRTSKTELVDISKAWIAISIAFAFVLSNTTIFSGGIFTFKFVLFFAVSLVTAGIGFLLHELGHKFVAQHYGCVAEFRAFNQMLYLAVGLAAVIGFIFAAPGAVMISGHITRKENGIISAAGPIVNYVLGVGFLIAGLFFQGQLIDIVISVGFMINMWLGLFNMLPFGNFDGKKILNWSRVAWSVMVVFGVYFTFFL
jgi:Zn-dependent protease